MKASIGKKLERATGVRDFNRAHPSDDPSFVTTSTQLEEKIVRAEVLVSQQRAGRIAELAAIQRRDDLRSALQSHLLRHVVRYGELAAREQPELIGRFRLPAFGATHKSYLIAAKAMRADALANKELLVKLGLSEAILTAFVQAVDQFEQVIDEIRQSRVAHVGAGVDLEAVTNEIFELIELLNTHNRFRFQDDAELLAAWDNIRTVPTVFSRKSKQPPPEAKESPAA